MLYFHINIHLVPNNGTIAGPGMSQTPGRLVQLPLPTVLPAPPSTGFLAPEKTAGSLRLQKDVQPSKIFRNL